MSIKITSDSTCDLSAEQLVQYNITLLPLCIVKDGVPHRDGLEINADDVFRHVDAGGSVSTAALNVSDYLSFFEPLSKEYDAVIHLNLGSGFSSCHQNARLAAEEFDNVYVVDSRNLSTGHGHMVLEAALAAERGMGAREIVSYLEGLADRVEASFVLDRLDYMVKGGRCSAVTMLGANLLKLKPCIEVKDGKMGVVKKYRGSFSKCLGEYVRDRLENRDDLVQDRIFITHTTCPPEILEQVRADVEKYASFAQIFTTRAGCTISAHCGPNTLGILFIRSE